MEKNAKSDPVTDGRAEARPSSSGNLPGVEEADAQGEVAELFERYRTRFDRPAVPGIVKCFATHPPVLRCMMGLAEDFLFVEGALTRRQKEMIATWVSSENDCPYCADSHGYFLRTLGSSSEELAAIQSCDLSSTAIAPLDRALLAFVDKVTHSSCKVSRTDIESLVEAGWTKVQIAEAVHITALFASFNRIANAFGLQSQGMLDAFKAEAKQSD